MHSRNLKIIKGAIVTIVVGAVFVMILSITLLRDNYYFRNKFVTLQLDYIKEEIAFIKYNYGSLTNWIMQRNEKEPPTRDLSRKAVSVPVLLYHGVMVDPNWKADGVNISLNDFREQLFTLKKAGYETVSLADFQLFIAGKKDLPEKSFMITFDDGRSDSYYPVDPVLSALDYQAVMFVITGRSLAEGNENSIFHLSQVELQKMLDSGRWEMGSHTQNGHDMEVVDSSGQTKGHFLSDKLWLDSEKRIETTEEYRLRVESDLAGSKSDLEKDLGVSVIGFAYPFGDYGQRSQNFLAAKEIVVGSVNSLFPLSFFQVGNDKFPNDYPGNNFRLIKRINVDQEMTTGRLLAIFNGGEEKALPFEDSFTSNKGWLVGWGNSELRNGLLLTGASDDEDSSLAFLNGTYGWTDYAMNADVQVIKGDAFALAARYMDGNNYVSCDFDSGEASLVERINGEEHDISEKIAKFILFPDKSTSVGISVAGNRASCYIGGKLVASGIISSSLSHGGVGFKTWDRTMNNSGLLISNLKVN